MSILTVVAILLGGLQAIANEREFRLYAPPKLVESGLLKYMLPRFSLKTQVRITVVEQSSMGEVVLGDQGKAVFSGLGQTWRLKIVATGHPGAERFADWIESEVGQRTITAFAVEGNHPFQLPEPEQVEIVALEMDGDAEVGQEVSQRMCARCHVVVASERMNAIGSTPSFFALRSLPDWDQRFAAFYALNPHPSFTQVDDVTPPFPEDRPPPIVPLEMTVEDIEAVLAYVASLVPADLGAPLQHQ